MEADFNFTHEMKHTYQISGMTCNGCKAHVEKTLKEVDGISDVSVDLINNEVLVDMAFHIPLQTLKDTMMKDGGRYDIHLPGSYEHQQTPQKSQNGDSGGFGHYYCPMLCEGDRKYDTPGDCPKCGMDLVKEEISRTIYTCPMHPEVEQDHAGSCPKCGMDLEPKNISHDDGSQEQKAYRKMHTKFWISVAFTLPVFFIAMSEMIGVSLYGFATKK